MLTQFGIEIDYAESRNEQSGGKQKHSVEYHLQRSFQVFPLFRRGQRVLHCCHRYLHEDEHCEYEFPPSTYWWRNYTTSKREQRYHSQAEEGRDAPPHALSEDLLLTFFLLIFSCLLFHHLA